MGFEEVAAYAEPRGVRLILEPVNRYEINFVNSVDDAASLLARVERDNVGIMPDTFHMNIEEGDPAEALRPAGVAEDAVDADTQDLGMGGVETGEQRLRLRHLLASGGCEVERVE